MDNKSGAAIVYESVPFNVSLVLIADSMGVLNYAKRPLEMPENTAYYYGLLLVHTEMFPQQLKGENNCLLFTKC